MVRLMTVLFTASLTLLGVASVQALPFTTSARVDVGLVAGDIGFVETAPPNSPLVDLSLPFSVTTTYIRFALSSLTAFVNSDEGISAQGVAQVDTLVAPLSEFRDPAPNGHANFELTFSSGPVPVAIELSGVMHRSGAMVGLLAGGVEFCPTSSPSPAPCFTNFYDGTQIGDFPFEFHATLPPGEFRLSTFAENAFIPFNLDHSTSESRLVWDLEVTPVPAPSTGFLLWAGIIGLAVLRGGRGQHSPGRLR
jgi:hypothetical protein